MRPRDLRNDLVAAALNAEPVDVVTAEERRQVLSRLAEVHALRTHLVAIEHDLRLRLVEPEIGIGEHEQPAGERLLHQLAGELPEPLGLGGRRDHEIHREISATGQRRRRHGDHANAGNLRQRSVDLHHQLLGGLRPFAPRLRDHAAESAGRKRELKDARGLGERLVDVVDLVRKHPGLIDRRVRRGLDDREDHALVLGRRQLALREHVERPHQEHDDGPERDDDGAIPQRSGEHAEVELPQALEPPVNKSGEPALGVARAEELRAHHRRERQRHDAGHDHRAGEREGELAEERAGEAALDADGRVDRGERDRHRDDRADQLARRFDRRPDRRLTEVHVPRDVLHHHDRVVHDETDRQHNGEQRQQVDREPGGKHQARCTDERDRNRDDRNDHGPDRAQEQEDHDDDDQERLAERREHFVDGVLDVFGRVVRNAGLHAGGQLRFDFAERRACPLDHVERVGGRQHPHAHEDRRLAVEPDIFLVVLRAEHDIGDLAEPHDHAAGFLDDELPELLGRPQIGVGDQVHRHHRALGPSER